MEMVFLGKTMNFVNATHVNGESESSENMNYASDCWRVEDRSSFFLLSPHVLLLGSVF